MAEEWRAVLGYEGLYEVSNFGRVRSLPHEVPTKIGACASGRRKTAGGYAWEYV